MKLYFMCGLPGERAEDLDGMIDMAETISRIARRSLAVRDGGRQRVELRARRIRRFNGTDADASIFGKPINICESGGCGAWRSNATTSKGACWKACCRGATAAWAGDRIGLAEREVRLLSDRQQPDLWWQALAETGINLQQVLHEPYAVDVAPWDRITIRQGRVFASNTRNRSISWRRCGRSKRCTAAYSSIKYNPKYCHAAFKW